MTDDFCLIHGYDYMRKSSIFDPIPYCSKCEKEDLLDEIESAEARKVADKMNKNLPYNNS